MQNNDSLGETYRLRFLDIGSGLERDLEFAARCDYHALQLARELSNGRTAQLWRDGKPVCRIRGYSHGGWSILPLNLPGLEAQT